MPMHDERRRIHAWHAFLMHMCVVTRSYVGHCGHDSWWLVAYMCIFVSHICVYSCRDSFVTAYLCRAYLYIFMSHIYAYLCRASFVTAYLWCDSFLRICESWLVPVWDTAYPYVSQQMGQECRDVYVYMYAYIRIYIHLCMYIHVIRTCHSKWVQSAVMYMYVYVYTCAYIRTYKHLYICGYTCYPYVSQQMGPECRDDARTRAAADAGRAGERQSLQLIHFLRHALRAWLTQHQSLPCPTRCMSTPPHRFCVDRFSLGRSHGFGFGEKKRHSQVPAKNRRVLPSATAGRHVAIFRGPRGRAVSCVIHMSPNVASHIRVCRGI